MKANGLLSEELLGALPDELRKHFGMSAGSEIEFRVREGQVILQEREFHRKRLTERLEGMTEENVHEAVDWGVPVGKETL